MEVLHIHYGELVGVESEAQIYICFSNCIWIFINIYSLSANEDIADQYPNSALYSKPLEFFPTYFQQLVLLHHHRMKILAIIII